MSPKVKRLFVAAVFLSCVDACSSTEETPDAGVDATPTTMMATS